MKEEEEEEEEAICKHEELKGLQQNYSGEHCFEPCKGPANPWP
jgi:hypothetical protein